MDESRKEFERFLREEHLYSDDELFWEEDRNCYSIYPVHIAWKSWQASREAIALDMPEPFKIAKSSSGLTYYYQDDVDAVLSCAGIKVKE